MYPDPNFDIVRPTNPCYEEDIKKVWVKPGSWKSFNEKNKGKAVTKEEQEQKDLSDAFAQFFNSGNVASPSGPPPKPVVYDDTGESTKIAEKYPMFGFATLLDEILDEFGGVSEIMSCNWNNIINEGTVTCLMKDWRVFRYTLKSNEFATLSHEDRKSKVNRECLVFEDMDDYGHWEELGGTTEENDKKAMVKKKSEGDMTVYGEKMHDAMDDFFSGNVEALQKMMSKNDGKSKTSYLDAEA